MTAAAVNEKPKRKMKPETILRGIEGLDAESIRQARAAIEARIAEIRKSVEAKVERRVAALRKKLDKLRTLEKLASALEQGGAAPPPAAEALADSDDEQLADRLETLLLASGPSQSIFLARQLGIDQERVKRILRGDERFHFEANAGWQLV